MTDAIFSPIDFGGITLPNLITMAPLTRSHTTQPGRLPNRMVAIYYAQRASAGMITTEATQFSPRVRAIL